MRTKNKNKLLGLALTGTFSLFGATNALAAAGDTIDNIATLSFSVGGGSALVLESSEAGNSTTGATNGTATGFVEDRLINFSVVEVGSATTNVGASETTVVQTFLVTNDGNGDQDFLLAALNYANGQADPWSASTDSFDVTSSQVFVESNVVPDGYTVVGDTAIYADAIAGSGGTATVYIVSTIPNATIVSNGDVAVMTLVAQVADSTGTGSEGAAIMNDDNGNISPAGVFSNTGTTTVAVLANDEADDATEQVVFNDPAGTRDSASAADIAQNGQASADDSYTVATADLTISKTASTALWDPINLASNPKSIPGAYVTYTITIANAGTAATSADLTTLTDTLVAGLALDPDFITSAGPGNPTNAAGDSFQVAITGSARGTASTFCTGSTADADGCGAVGNAISVDHTVLSIMGVEGVVPNDYTAGELKPGESVVITFNAIIQ